MQLVDDGLISINDYVVKYIPELNSNGKQLIQISNLLLHNAGLAPDVPPSFIKTKEMAMDWIYNCKLDAPIGSQFVYSDISFILLGEIVERVSGTTLNENVKANL